MKLPAATVLALMGALLRVDAQEMRPDLGKLQTVSPFPAVVEFARTHQLSLQGIDAPTLSDRLIPGDSVTALISLFQRGESKSQWLLSIQAAQPTAAEQAKPARPILVLYAGAGEKLEFSQSRAPVELLLAGPFAESHAKTAVKQHQARISVNPAFLSLGLDAAAAADYRIVQHHFHGGFEVRSRPFTATEAAAAQKSVAGLHLSVQEQRALAGAMLALQSYVEIVQQTPGLDALFYKVVKPPSLWSIIRHAGVNVTLSLEAKFIAPTPATLWHLPPETPCYTYPLSLRVNDQPALLTTLIVAPPRPPLLESAGIVGMLAENPKEKETFLLLQIVSAHCHRGAK